MTDFEKLAAHLQNLPTGAVSDGAKLNVASLLSHCWDQFEGAGVSKMGDWKLVRDEGPQQMTWSPPLLSFIIERHGGMALGSTRAEKQQWILDIEKKTARQEKAGSRQAYPREPVLDVKSIADAVCKAVQEGPHSKSVGILVWKGDDDLVIKHSRLIPNVGFRQTIAGRRRRFRTDLQHKLEALGWELVKTGQSLTFKRR
jgi:hypothetical protein